METFMGSLLPHRIAHFIQSPLPDYRHVGLFSGVDVSTEKATAPTGEVPQRWQRCRKLKNRLELVLSCSRSRS